MISSVLTAIAFVPNGGQMKRNTPRSRTASRPAASAFTKPMTSKNEFPPIDVQAVSARSNDKPMGKVRKGIIETGSGGGG